MNSCLINLQKKIRGIIGCLQIASLFPNAMNTMQNKKKKVYKY